MNFTMFNLTTSDIRFKVTDSSGKQASLDTDTVANPLTPNNTVYVDNGVVNGCVSGIKNDVLLLPYLGNGVVTQSMGNLAAYTSNAVDKSYGFVIFTPYASADVTSGMFSGNCRVIKQLIFNGSNIQNIDDGAFQGVPILSLNNSNAATMNIGKNAFNNCSLTGALNLYNVASVGDYAFASNTLMSKITLSNIMKTVGVGAFSHTGVTNVQMPPSITAIPDELFQGCSYLTTLDFTALWDGSTQLKSIGANFVDSCYNLTTINCPWTTPPTLDPAAFGNLVQMSSYSYNNSETVPFTINVPSSAVSAYKNATGWSSVANAIQGVSSNASA